MKQMIVAATMIGAMFSATIAGAQTVKTTKVTKETAKPEKKAVTQKVKPGGVKLNANKGADQAMKNAKPAPQPSPVAKDPKISR